MLRDLRWRAVAAGLSLVPLFGDAISCHGALSFARVKRRCGATLFDARRCFFFYAASSLLSLDIAVDDERSCMPAYATREHVAADTC